MAIRVEFFGTVRSRTGVAETALVPVSGKMRLGEALAILAARFPQLSGHCLQGNQIADGYAACIDGKLFVDDANYELEDEQTLLLMSSDAGG